MRNLYLLETPKPSRLHLGKSGLVLCDLVFNPTTINSQHVYITSDEKLKAGEYCITFGSDKCKGQLDTFQSNVRYSRNPSKIILTTDPDLIKDGVQELDDKFLQWFVKNHTCEYIHLGYKVYKPSIKKWYPIIPREEHNPELVMKNIFVLPTDKPSRLLQCLKVIELLDKEWLSPIGKVNRNIYITSSEKPKEGDWVYENNLNQETKIYQIIKRDGRLMFFRFRSVPIWLDENQHGCKKIILTTDPDLIKDGVQAIDDEFLKWFVKNPSCESVEVINDLLIKEDGITELMNDKYYQKFPEELPNCVFINNYKIIIPQEETKQETRVFGTKEDKTIQVGHPDKHERTGSLVECIQNIINDQLKVISEIEKAALEEPKQLQKMKNKIFYEYSYRDYFLAKLKDESFVVVFKAYGKDGYLQDEFQNLIDINSIEREANGKEYYDYFTKRGIKQGALCSRWRNEFKPIFQFLESTKKYDPQPVIVTLGHGKHYPNGHGMSLCNYTFDFKSNSLLSMTKEEPIDKSFYENTDLTITIEPQTSKEDDERWSLASAKEFALNHFKKSDEVPSKGMFTYELLLRILEAGIECGYKFGTKQQASVKYSEEDRFEGSQPKSQRMFSEMQVHQIIELIRITGLSPEFIMKQFNEK